jgi:serine/threonine-protein phosphatase 6 regulatory subunit 3
MEFLKKYCWNNFLHTQVKICVKHAFESFEQNANSLFIVSELQKHVVGECRIVSKLIDCWYHNTEVESETPGHRLGYMGHVIEMFNELLAKIKLSEDFSQLVQASMDEADLAKWQELTDTEEGFLPKIMAVQSRFLADCDPNQKKASVHEFSASPKEFSEILTNLCDAQESFEKAYSKANNELDFDTGDESNLWNENFLASAFNNALNMDELDPNTLILSNEDLGVKLGGDGDVDFFNSAIWLNKPGDADGDIEKLMLDNPWGGDANQMAVTGFGFGSDDFADFDSHFKTLPGTSTTNTATTTTSSRDEEFGTHCTQSPAAAFSTSESDPTPAATEEAGPSKSEEVAPAVPAESETAVVETATPAPVAAAE